VYLTVRPTDIFNAAGAASQEVMRQLLYAAETGNENVLTPFSTPDGVGDGPKAQVKRERDDREFEQWMEFTLASQEKMEEFERKLDLLDQASAEALAENEAQLREAKEALKRIRDRAYTVDMPDGSRVKVYRDGAAVRNDDGALVSPQVLKPTDIPDTAPTWAERHAAGQLEEHLMSRNKAIRRYQTRLERDRTLVESGRMTKGQLHDMGADLDQMPDEVRTQYDRLRSHDPAEPVKANTSEPDPTFRTSNRPTGPFSAAANGAFGEQRPDPAITPAPPSVSTPGPT
jgi:hypothetical protein